MPTTSGLAPAPCSAHEQACRIAVGIGLSAAGLGMLMSACSCAHRLIRSGPAAAPLDAAVLRPQIMLFGDSITQQAFKAESSGWGAQLANWYARQADVVSRGFSGYNTRQVHAYAIST
eukprot:SAG31_NODE_9863_length_1219_cov_1.430357_1_plen_118_part_00